VIFGSATVRGRGGAVARGAGRGVGRGVARGVGLGVALGVGEGASVAARTGNCVVKAPTGARDGLAASAGPTAAIMTGDDADRIPRRVSIAMPARTNAVMTATVAARLIGARLRMRRADVTASIRCSFRSAWQPQQADASGGFGALHLVQRVGVRGSMSPPPAGMVRLPVDQRAVRTPANLRRQDRAGSTLVSRPPSSRARRSSPRPRRSGSSGRRRPATPRRHRASRPR
jgi:hypothetical protein